jgi:VIT1/CCC1 family predicted Fe2+/Mn2+ transporter
LILPVATSMATSVALTGLALFLVGARKARLTVGRPVRSGLEMAAIGIVSALIGYAIGAALKTPSAP